MTSPSTSDRPLRVAVWGLGGHAVKRILPALRASASVELYGVCSRNAVVVNGTAASFGCRGWTDAATMLADAGVDVVFVATPTGLHAEHGHRVIGAHKHLWCEKPLTATLDDTLSLLAQSRAAGVAVCEGLMYLHHPQFARLAEIVADGRLGAIRSMQCRFGMPALDRASFRSDPALGGGAFLDLGIYPVSAVLALSPAGACEVRHANIARATGSAVDTDGYAVIAMPGGAVAHVEWRMRASYRNEIELWGERQSLLTDRVFTKQPDYIPEFHFRDAQGNGTTETGAAGDQFILMLDAFRRMVADAEAGEAERGRILRRAQLLSSISSVADRR